MRKYLLSAISLVVTTTLGLAQVGIGTNTPNASAMLDVTATNKGLLIPRVALTSNTDIVTVPSPAASLLVYNTATAGSGRFAVSPGYFYWNSLSLSWTALAVADNSLKAAWLLGGNTGTSSINNFIGTTDNQSLIFKINNINAGYLGTGGNAYWGLNSGNTNSSGVSNVAIGNAALFQNAGRSNLVAVGDSALYTNSLGQYNTAVGSKALFSNTTGDGNTAHGYQSLFSNTWGHNNTANGHLALYSNITGDDNTATGYKALYANDGVSNTAYGNESLKANTTGNFNTATGFFSLQSNTIGGRNTATGFRTLLSNTTGVNNDAFGGRALEKNISGSDNIGIGYESQFFNINGNDNIAVGSQSLYNNSTGHSNIAIGSSALRIISSGSNIVAVGDSALYFNVVSANTAIGSKSLYNNVTGFHNTAVGFNAAFNTTFGSNNTATGFKSLYSNASGDDNTAYGYQSLFNNVSGGQNAAYGNLTLGSNSTGNKNTALGYAALFSNTIGYNNVAIGTNALYLNTDGINSVAVGYAALANNTGFKNVAMGYHALYANTTGVGNTAIGEEALDINTTGGQNTALGYHTSVSESGKSNATAVGAFARADCGNCMVLGSVEGINGAYSSVNVGIGTNMPQTKLQVATGGLAGSILLGANKYAGGFTNLEMGISAASNGFSYIQSTQASGTTWGSLALNAAGGNVGVGINTALATLHIKQRTETYPVNGGGLRLERQTNTNHWDIGTDNGDDLDFAFNGVAKAYINDGTGVYTTVSDRRFKKDISSLSMVLPAVMLLQAKTYHYTDNNATASLSYGFIAQDVEKVFPDFVTTKGGDSVKAIAYQNFSVVAIKAIQEQQQMIEKQQKLIAGLQERLDALEGKKQH